MTDATNDNNEPAPPPHEDADFGDAELYGNDGGGVKKVGKVTAFMTSSWTLLAAIVATLFLLRYAPSVTEFMRPFGEAYMNFLKMTIIPFAVSATVSSLCKVMRERQSSHIIRRTVISACIVFMALVAYGLSAAVLTTKQVEPSEDTLAYIGEMMFENVKPGEVEDNWAVFSIHTRDKEPPRASTSLKDTLIDSIPENIFEALTEGDMVKILIFFCIFALTARYMPEDGYRAIQSFADGVMAAFVRILDWLFFLASPGIACIIANTFANVDLDIVWKFTNLIILILATIIIACIACLVVVWLLSGSSFLHVVGTLQDSLFIALAANSELLAMPKAMQALNTLGFDKKVINIVMPLGINLIPFGPTVLFSVAAVFCVNLYNIPLNAETICILAMTIPLASVATVQSSPLVWYCMVRFSLDSPGHVRDTYWPDIDCAVCDRLYRRPPAQCFGGRGQRSDSGTGQARGAKSIVNWAVCK